MDGKIYKREDTVELYFEGFVCYIVKYPRDGNNDE